MANLSIEDYDRAEAFARRSASYSAIRAFSTGYFNLHGVPTRADHPDEIRRYVDMMGEIRAFDGWEKAFFNDEEAERLLLLRQIIFDMTSKHFLRPVDPVANLLAPWTILRVVRHLSRKLGRPLNIFEA